MSIATTPLGWRIALPRLSIRTGLRFSPLDIGTRVALAKSLPGIQYPRLGTCGFQRSGHLKLSQQQFKEQLLTFIPPTVIDSIKASLSAKKYSDTEIDDLLATVANTITRANGDKLAWLCDWGVLKEPWLQHIAQKNPIP